MKAIEQLFEEADNTLAKINNNLTEAEKSFEALKTLLVKYDELLTDIKKVNINK